MATIKVPRSMIFKTGDKKSKRTTVPTSTKPKTAKKSTDSCQSLDTIPEKEPNEDYEFTKGFRHV